MTASGIVCVLLLLGACCAPVDPQSVQPGSGTCGAYIPVTSTGNGGGAQR